jgi:hypothetical protein
VAESPLKHCITPDGKIRWHSSVHFDKSVQIGRLRVHAQMRKGDGFTGRLGGGWSWKLGILAARTEVVFDLFVMSIRFRWFPLAEPPKGETP